MSNPIITVRLSDGSSIIRKAIKIFDNERRATVRYGKKAMVVRRVNWFKSGDIWIDADLYTRYEREGDPELNEVLKEQESAIAAQREEISPAALEWTPEEVASHDEWYEHGGKEWLDAQGEQIAPAAPAISLRADVFNLDYSPTLPPLLFRGYTSRSCLIENIYMAGATLEGTVQLEKTAHIPGGALTVRVERNMWLACAFSPNESEVK